MSIYFDDSGIVVDSIDTVKQEMVDRANVLLAPYLNGTELRSDDSSVLVRIFSILSVPAIQTAQIIPLWISSLDLNSAEGLQLDFLADIFNTKRLPPSQSEGYAILFGDMNTIIPENTRVSNTRTGDVFSTNSQVTLDNQDVNGVEVEVVDITSPITISYSINGYLSSSPNISVQLGTNDTTIIAVANRIVDAVNSQSSYLKAVKNNDNSVKIEIIDKNKVGDFSVSTNLTIARVYKPVRIKSDTYTSDEALENTITSIRTPLSGFKGVTNPFSIPESKGVEDDEELRYRLKLIRGANNAGSYNSILFALNSVSGVSFANIQQNTSPNTSGSGIVNNGVSITVSGGNEDDIALAIFNTLPVGIITVGDITKTVLDVNGGQHTIKFSRPKIVPLEISMSLIVYPDFPAGGQVAIKQAIVEWFNNLNVGEDVYYSRLYEPINSIRGFSVRNLKIGRAGQTLQTEDIIISYNEIATISHENIRIGGS